MSEVHLPHQHSDEGTMRELQESVETIGSFQTVADVFKQLSDSSRVRIFWLLCHCEECVIDLSAMVGMSSPAVSHHLRQLRESGLLVSRRVGKEVYYRASDSEQAQLLHRMIERTMEISCPEEESKAVAAAPHLPPLDAEVYEGGGTSEQIETIRAVHDYLTQHLSSRVTIDELSRRFLMNPSTMKALFKSVYGSSLASHIREHRMQHAAKLLLEGEDEIEYLANVLYEVETAPGEQALNEVRAELKSQGYLKYYKQRERKQKPADFLRYRSSDGFEILIGRNNLQNDKLTLHTARGKDVWFHVQKAPGSHTVVMSRGEDVPDTTKQEAAELAVVYSSTFKAGAAAKVAVDTTEVKNIWKANGAKPGMVLYEVYTTVYVTPREKLLDELKANAKK